MQRQIYWWKRQGKIALLEQILRFQNRQWAGRCLCRGVLPTCLGGSENLRGPYTNPSFFGRIRVCFHSNQNLEEGRILPPGGPGSDGPVYLRRQNAAGETSETMLLLPTYLHNLRGIWQYGLWSFQTGDTKLERFCLRINIPKGNYWFLSFGLTASCQKVPKFDFQSKFSMAKIIRIFLNFVYIEEYQFRSTFFVIDIFW